MAAATSLPNDMVYNLSTVGHGDHDHDWDDYIDYSPEKGVVYDSHDYTYGVPVNRADIRPFKDIPADMVDHIRASVITILMQIGKVFEASMWIGSSTCYNLGLPCKIVRSRKFRGDATLINIASKHDRYNREIYKAFIVGSDGLKYYVSPNCVQVDKDTISALLNRMTLKELVDILDESHFGHWNYAPYNRRLFHFIELIAKYTRGNEKIDLKEYKWGWQVEQEKEQEAA